MNDADTAAKLSRAKGYPYPTPAHSYLYVNGAAYEIDGYDGDPVYHGNAYVDDKPLPTAKLLRRLGIHSTAGLDRRVPVIAHGSNASPLQLARKFKGLAGDVVIPVLRGGLSDFDVVYAAQVTGYGSIPATLAASPGTTAEIAVVFLTSEQLSLMHGTEGLGANYVYGRLGGIFIDVDGLDPLTEAFVYLTLHGCAMLSEKPAALAAVTAHHRRFPALTMPGMLALARDRLAPDVGLDAFILENIDNEALRIERTEALRRHAERPHFPFFDVMVG